MKYSTAVIIFGLLSAGLAPFVIHKIKSTQIATGALVVLAIFASFPLKKLFGIDGLAPELATTLAYGCLLFLIGFGWKRKWK